MHSSRLPEMPVPYPGIHSLRSFHCGFIVGLQAEGRLLRKQGAQLVACAGGSAKRAEELGLELAAQGAELLISFGLAGGLSPVLRAGDLVLADRLTSPDGLISFTERSLRLQLAAKLTPYPLTGTILGFDRPVKDAAEKTLLYEQNEAVAVDMESHGLARAAVQAKLPFLVVRAIADPASRTIPNAALSGFDATGRIKPKAVLHSLGRNPREIPQLIGLALEAQAGMSSLRRISGQMIRLLS